MATSPDKEWNKPLQPGITQPEPTPFPDPAKTGEPRPADPNPVAPPEE